MMKSERGNFKYQHYLTNQVKFMDKNNKFAKPVSSIFFPFSIISFLKVTYWKLTVPVLPPWTSVFPRTLNLCREHTTKYSP